LQKYAINIKTPNFFSPHPYIPRLSEGEVAEEYFCGMPKFGKRFPTGGALGVEGIFSVAETK